MDPSYYDAQKNLYKLSPNSLPPVLQLGDGTAANPSLKFISDTDTGLYRPSANTLGITTGGTERVRISDTGLQSAYDIQGLTFKFDADNTNYLDYDSGGNRIRHIINGISKFSVSDTLTGSINPIHIPAGTLSDLALAFITDPDTGLYVPGANQLGFAAGGSNALTLSSSLALFASEARADKFSFSDSITSYLEFENVGLSIDLYNASNLKLRIASAYSEHYNVFRNALGTAANTSYSFIGDGGTGIYSSSIYNIDAACNGTQVLNLTTDGLKTVSGLVGTPSISFLSDQDTGIYLIGANTMGFTAGGTLCAYINNSDFIAQSRILINSMGVVGAPAFSFLGDTNSGFYQSALDNLDIAAGGVRIINFNSGSVLLGLDGSAAGPSLGFISDTDTGIYRPGVNRFAIGCGGALCSEFTTGYIANAVPIYASTGGAGTPGYSFGGDTNTGFYWNGADQIGISQNGAARWLFNSSYNFQPAATNTYDIGTSSVLLRDCYSTRFLASDGSVSTPSIAFLGDTDTGIYRPENNALAVTCAGALVFGCYQTVTKSFNVFQNSDGTASIPSYSFYNSNNLGMYRSGTNTLTFSTNGVGRVSINTANLITDLPIIAPGGSAGAPGYTFSGDTDTGLGLTNTNTIGFTTGGTFRVSINTANLISNIPVLAPGGSTTVPGLSFSNQTTCGMSSFYTNQVDFLTNSVHRFSITNNSILPAVSSSYNLGSGGLLMHTIYASVGTINTSDRNLKENITDCPLGLDFVNKLKPVKYKWKNRSYEEKYYDQEAKEEKIRTIEKIHQRYHCGLIAQDVKETLDELQISTNDFAGYVDSSINEPGINTLGLNYTQFIAPMIKAIQEMSQKINELSSRIGEDN